MTEYFLICMFQRIQSVKSRIELAEYLIRFHNFFFGAVRILIMKRWFFFVLAIWMLFNQFYFCRERFNFCQMCELYIIILCSKIIFAVKISGNRIIAELTVKIHRKQPTKLWYSMWYVVMGTYIDRCGYLIQFYWHKW